VGVGDAENDHAFLRVCGFSAAVSNALQSVKDMANWTTPGPRGRGVTQLIDEIIARDDKLFDLISPQPLASQTSGESARKAS
jgi:3-deoxy-D-manno-octulosonate 8-phosphate phosphatase KdsC-like HAD superfamily phosphatase